MTGMGIGETPLSHGVLRVELRALNHRHLDVRVRASHELLDAAWLIEDEVRSRCVRGRIEAHARWEACSQTEQPIDSSRARAVYQTLCQLRDELAVGQDIPIAVLASVPGLFTGSMRFDADSLTAAVKIATERAAAELRCMRATEGAALLEDLMARIAVLRGHASFIASHRQAIVEGARTRLVKRIEKLLDGSNVQLDPARMVQEVAWFADKSDIAEELTRLDSHMRQFEALARSGDGHVGKKLDFLIQEMSREVNTVGSKANDAELTHRVVEMKSELERLREQVQNVL